MTTDLAAWLLEQIAADEEVARNVTLRQPLDEWDAVGDRRDDDIGRSHWGVVRIARVDATPAARDIATHIALHDPARVLAECAAKRRLVERWREADLVLLSGPGDIGFCDGLGEALYLLAAPYADREGFQNEWLP